ncbi:CPLN1 protein, partial [Psilopogon haemacephalus]|nr:CPLN1 protein [Psilopogon haemacephalus]
VLKVYRDVGITAGNEVSDIHRDQSVTPVPVSESPGAPETLHPDTHLNVRFPAEVKERPLPSFLSDVPDLSEHEYLSVTDIEGSEIPNLPMIPEPAEEIGTAQQMEEFEILCAAKLHQKAVSVTDAVPPRVLQKKG